MGQSRSLSISAFLGDKPQANKASHLNLKAGPILKLQTVEPFLKYH